MLRGPPAHPLLFGLRLWASVRLALYWLQLDKRILGRHVRGAGVPAASRRVAA
jgi:hypothetical protein